jgi:hypothetical protein
MFLWSYDKTTTSCSAIAGAVGGFGDGSCTPVRVGNIGSMQVFCSAADRSHTRFITWNALLAVGAVLTQLM